MTNWAEKVTQQVTKTVTVMPKPAATSGCPAEVICRCLGVTHQEVESAIDLYGADSVDELKGQTGAGGGCTACHRILRQVLAARRVQFES